MHRQQKYYIEAAHSKVYTLVQNFLDFKIQNFILDPSQSSFYTRPPINATASKNDCCDELNIFDYQISKQSTCLTGIQNSKKPPQQTQKMSSNLAKRSSSFQNTEMMNTSCIKISNYFRHKSQEKVLDSQDLKDNQPESCKQMTQSNYLYQISQKPTCQYISKNINMCVIEQIMQVSELEQKQKPKKLLQFKLRDQKKKVFNGYKKLNYQKKNQKLSNQINDGKFGFKKQISKTKKANQNFIRCRIAKNKNICHKPILEEPLQQIQMKQNDDKKFLIQRLKIQNELSQNQIQDVQNQDLSNSKILILQKIQKIQDFRNVQTQINESGQLYFQNLQDMQVCLLKKEINEMLTYKNESSQVKKLTGPGQSPIQGHMISNDFRTKMADWMVEVCTSFQRSQRTYFLSVKILDSIFLKAQQNGVVLENKDVYLLGVSSIYIASKYEDIQPLHSKFVSQKIAHDEISSQEILNQEKEFLLNFKFEIDFPTSFDFYQVYSERLSENLKIVFDVSEKFKQQQQVLIRMHHNKLQILQLIENLKKITLLLIKMSMQCSNFCQYSQSVIVLSSFYAATAFLKHSKKLQCEESNIFVDEARQLILQLIFEHKHILLSNIVPKINQENNSCNNNQIELFQNQFTKKFIEQVSMDLVDFYMSFEQWHCGLNQLKKFNIDQFNELANTFS